MTVPDEWEVPVLEAWDQLWTDGSGTVAETPGGWAYVLVSVDGTREAFGGVSVGGTNNRMELTAVLMGLRSLADGSRVEVYSDSEYVTRGFSDDLVARWAERGWRRVKNPDDLWRDLVAEVARMGGVRWHHVPGHDGLVHNERADYLSGQARLAMVGLAEAGDGHGD